MSIALTEMQARCLAFLKRRLAETGGVCPSYDEITAGLGLASKSGVHRLLSDLELRGRIRRLPHKVRAIEVLDQPAEIDLASLGDDELKALGARVAAELAGRLARGARP